MKAPDALPLHLAPRCALQRIQCGGTRCLAALLVLAAMLWLAPAARATEFPQRFQIVCPQLLPVPAGYPDKARLEQACQQLSQTTFSLAHDGTHWRLTPGLDGSAQTPLTRDRAWPPHTCLSTPFVAICQVPAQTRIQMPGMGANGWVQSRHGFILVAALAGVFDLMPFDALDTCAPQAATGPACDPSQP